MFHFNKVEKRQLHVCIITTTHDRFDGRIFHRQAITLNNAGYRITFLVPGSFNGIEKGIRIISFPLIKNKYKRLISNIRIVRTALKLKADIYHFHDPDFLLYGLVLKWISKQVVIFDVHEDFSLVLLEREWIPKWLRKIYSAVYRFTEKFASKVFDGIITATDHIQTLFPKEESIIVHNYPENKNKSLKRKNIIPNSLVYIGGLNPIRGIEEMLKAVVISRDKLPIKIHTYGQFTDMDYKKRIMSDFKHDYIHFHDVLPMNVMHQKASQYSAGIICYLPLPNHIESMPNKIFEYMMLGLPIIGSNFPLWKKLINDNKCGITCDPTSPQKIADAILTLFSDATEIENKAQTSIELFNKCFTWTNEKQILLNFYSSIIENSYNKI